MLNDENAKHPLLGSLVGLGSLFLRTLQALLHLLRAVRRLGLTHLLLAGGVGLVCGILTGGVGLIRSLLGQGQIICTKPSLDQRYTEIRLSYCNPFFSLFVLAFIVSFTDVSLTG